MSRQIIIGIIVGAVVVVVGVLGVVFREQLFTQVAPPDTSGEQACRVIAGDASCIGGLSIDVVTPLISSMLNNSVATSVMKDAVNKIYAYLKQWPVEHQYLEDTVSSIESALTACQSGGADTACYSTVQSQLDQLYSRLDANTNQILARLSEMRQAANFVTTVPECRDNADCVAAFSAMTQLLPALEYYIGVITDVEASYNMLVADLDEKKAASASVPSSVSGLDASSASPMVGAPTDASSSATGATLQPVGESSASGTVQTPTSEVSPSQPSGGSSSEVTTVPATQGGQTTTPTTSSGSSVPVTETVTQPQTQTQTSTTTQQPTTSQQTGGVQTPPTTPQQNAVASQGGTSNSGAAATPTPSATPLSTTGNEDAWMVMILVAAGLVVAGLGVRLLPKR